MTLTKEQIFEAIGHKISGRARLSFSDTETCIVRFVTTWEIKQYFKNRYFKQYSYADIRKSCDQFVPYDLDKIKAGNFSAYSFKDLDGALKVIGKYFIFKK